MHQELCPLVEQGARDQEETFARCAKRFAAVYASLPEDPAEYVTPFWREKISELEADWLPSPPFDFLRHKVVAWTMFVPVSKFTPDELKGIGETFEEDEMDMLLAESHTGQPRTCAKYPIETSGNTIHHLYHIARYSQITGNPVAAGRILEWGGGYGNMAKLYKRLWGHATYTMIDTRMFSAIQWLYLSCIYGEKEVVLHTEPGQEVEARKINIVPLGLAEKLECEADLFVSTWAISESAEPCQTLLKGRGLFGAKRVLIGHQGTSSAFPFADSVKKMVKGKCVGEDIKHLPGNRYLCR